MEMKIKTAIWAVAVTAISMASLAQATVYTWTGIDDNWTNAANWDINGIPATTGASNYLGGANNDITITNSQSLAMGGAIANKDAALTINGTSNTFTNNYVKIGTATTDLGGHIYSNGDLSVTNSTFTGRGGTNYDFSSEATIDGRQPWDEIEDYRISLPVRFSPSERSDVIIIPSVRTNAESGARVAAFRAYSRAWAGSFSLSIQA